MGLEVWQDVLKASWEELDGEDKQACPTPQGLPISSDRCLSEPPQSGGLLAAAMSVTLRDPLW